MFKAPPLDQVAAGTPAALPKPFNVVPPDKNTSPSVKITDVGGGGPNSSLAPVILPVVPTKLIPAEVETHPELPITPDYKSFNSVQLVPFQLSVVAL